MKVFQGRGKGGATGFPVEAVVQDLCDSRKSLAKAMVSVNDSKAAVEQMRTDVVARLDTLITAVGDLVSEIRASLDEGQQIRTEMAAVQAAARGVKDALDRSQGGQPGA